MGQAEESNQHVCGLTELKQVKEWGKRPDEFKPYYETLLPENIGTYRRGWPDGKLVQKYVIYARQSQQQATWHRNLHGRLSHKEPVWLGAHSQSAWKDCTRRQWCLPSHDLQSDHGGRSSHTRNTVVSLQTWLRLHMPSFSQTRWTCSKKWNLRWAAPTGTQPCTVFGYKDFCGSSAMGMLESGAMNG